MAEDDSSHKKAERSFRKAFPALVGILVILSVLPFFLNQLAWLKLKRSFPFDFAGSPQLFVPGRISAAELRLKRSGLEIETGPIQVRYDPVSFFLTRTLKMKIQGAQLTIRAVDLGIKNAEAFSELEFDTLKAELETEAKGGTEIKQLELDGPALLGMAEGRLKRHDIRLKVKCFLKPDFTSVLPKFLTEHLFSDSGDPLKQIQFQMSGDWDSPSFSIASDLVKFEVVNRDA